MEEDSKYSGEGTILRIPYTKYAYLFGYGPDEIEFLDGVTLLQFRAKMFYAKRIKGNWYRLQENN